MKNGLIALALGLALAGWSGADDGHKHHKHGAADGASATIEGEIVDLACFMTHGGSGKEHAKCAKQCIVKGAPAGILGADGSVTLLVEDHEAKKGFDQVKKLGGEKAKVTGKKVMKGGLNALVVTSAEAVK